MLDYPGKVAAAVFLPGCHLRCPYCHNPEFVDPRLYPENPHEGMETFNADVETFRAFIDKRASVLGGVVFSGGEALLNPLLSELMEIAREKGLAIKLDTAGLLPDRLEKLIQSKILNFVAMDFKTLPERYSEIGWNGSGEKSANVLLRRTLDMLADSNVDYEVRTTVVPPLVDKDILKRMEPHLAGVPKWVWQPYVPGHTLNPDWSDLRAPGEETLKIWLEDMKSDLHIKVR